MRKNKDQYDKFKDLLLDILVSELDDKFEKNRIYGCSFISKRNGKPKSDSSTLKKIKLLSDHLNISTNFEYSELQPIWGSDKLNFGICYFPTMHVKESKEFNIEKYLEITQEIYNKINIKRLKSYGIRSGIYQKQASGRYIIIFY